MPIYAALLRGIMPSNPNMRNEKLRAVFESLGFSNVQTIISSGNVIFESKVKDTPANISSLEEKIEVALFEQLGIKSPTYIRSKEQLETVIKKDPFKGAAHGPKSYLIVSFRKEEPREVFNALDTTHPSTTKFMAEIDKKFNKQVTTRTWKTVQRIVDKMN